MTVTNTTTSNSTFTINTGWLTPEHSERVLALNEARDAALDEIQDEYVAAYEAIEDLIERLKSKLEVLDAERIAARRVIEGEHHRAVQVARGQQSEDEKR